MSNEEDKLHPRPRERKFSRNGFVDARMNEKSHLSEQILRRSNWYEERVLLNTEH